MVKLRHFLSLIRFEHSVFALPFALVAAILAQKWVSAGGVFFTPLNANALPLFAASAGFGSLWSDIAHSAPSQAGLLPSGWDIFFIIVAMISGRTLAMLANRLIDAEIDKLNPRTRNWHIPKGLVSPGEAVRWMFISCLVFLLSALALNLRCFLLAPLAIIYLALYPYAKRVTSLCHFVLGGAQALAPLGVFLAITGQIPLAAIPFSLAVGLWVAGFDIYYSLQDYEFDIGQGLHSLPVKIGKKASTFVALLCHILVGLLFFFTSLIFHMGGIFALASFVLTLVLALEFLLVVKDERYIGVAFFSLNGFISIFFFLAVLAGVLIDKAR